MTFPLGESVTHHVRGVTGQDADGNDIYADSSSTAVDHVALYPRDSTEVVQGQDQNVVGLVAVFLPPRTIAATDQITARGHRWDVDAEVGQYHSPLTGTEVSKVNLRRVTG